ncbi:MAG: hypothetical protein ABSF44_02730 [Candidatus Bathyarchaeia archaeon]
MRMPTLSDERKDNLLGGFAIILLGVLLSGSAVWGLVYDIYSMTGATPVLFIILGVGSIILGILITLHKPEAQTNTV